MSAGTADIAPEVLRQALEDATEFRSDTGSCRDCRDGRICADHAADAALMEQYMQALGLLEDITAPGADGGDAR